MIATGIPSAKNAAHAYPIQPSDAPIQMPMATKAEQQRRSHTAEDFLECNVTGDTERFMLAEASNNVRIVHYKPAALRSSPARCVLSHVKSGSLRPKWPPAAVLR